ncbi:MAG TPA: prolipoprotein diacylglyceryl transferase [Stellaceae bacterium]|nr:prolipoprotein diacylglyceryl transferase [Stellaceae bacterium]
MTLPYPFTDPTAPIALALHVPEFHLFGLDIGPLEFDIRWYALAYIAGLLTGWRYCLALVRKPPPVARALDMDDFLVWATLGVVLGGRSGYVLFYRPAYYLDHPSEILQVWHGGMSFHGGALGVLVAMVLFCRQRKIALLGFADIIACAVPIGLFFGRIANFINGELWGRVSDVPWAMVFPSDPDQLPRHPSQLYEATFEGAVLFVVLYLLQRSDSMRRRRGTLTGAFLIGYALARIVGETFRQPDANLGFLIVGTTMGQLLSLPLLLGGALLVWYAWRKPLPA